MNNDEYNAHNMMMVILVFIGICRIENIMNLYCTCFFLMNSKKKMKATLICKVRTITFPRIIPSKVFIAWKFNNESGESELMSADSASTDAHYKIQLIYDQRKENKLELALCASDKASNRFRLGTDIIDIPIFDIESYEKGQPKPSHLTVIETSAGKFTIYTTFKEANFPIPKNHEKKKITREASYLMSPLEMFKEYITSLKPVPDVEHSPDTLWGENGLINLLQSFEFLETSSEDIRFIRDTETILPIKLKNTQLFSNTITTATSLMTNRDPLYISYDGKAGTSQELELNRRYSYLAIFICTFINEHLQDESLLNLINILLILFTQMTNIICYQDANQQQIFYLLTTVLFINQWLLINSPELYRDAQIFAILQTAIKSVMMKYLEYITKHLIRICKNERQIIDFLKSLNEDFYLNSIGESFTGPVIPFLLNYIDYTVVYQWIFDEELDSFNMSNLLSQYPDAQWKFIKSLMIIINERQKIISKKRFPENIYYYMNSQLGISALQKLYKLGQLKSKKQIDFQSFKSIENKNIENPYKPDAWSIENSIFGSDQDFPMTLPKLPENINI